MCLPSRLSWRCDRSASTESERCRHDFSNYGKRALTSANSGVGLELPSGSGRPSAWGGRRFRGSQEPGLGSNIHMRHAPDMYRKMRALLWPKVRRLGREGRLSRPALRRPAGDAMMPGSAASAHRTGHMASRTIAIRIFILSLSVVNCHLHCHCHLAVIRIGT